MLVVLSEALGAAGAYADKHGYEIDTNQEMVVIGAANLGSGLLGGLAAGGSMSQTAVNEAAGARSELSTIIASALVLVTVLVLTPLFTDLPQAVLAALIIHAVARMVEVHALRRLRRLHRAEFVIALVTLAAVLGADPQHPGTYVARTRHAGVEPVSGVAIVRLDAPLFYANASRLQDAVLGLVPGPRAIVLDLGASEDLDDTAVDELAKLRTKLSGLEIELVFAELRAPAMATAVRSGLLDGDDGSHMFPTVAAAVRARSHPPELSV